jgi:hypothetical protein
VMEIELQNGDSVLIGTAALVYEERSKR